MTPSASSGRAYHSVQLVALEIDGGQTKYFSTGYRNLEWAPPAAEGGDGIQTWRGVGLVTRLELPERSAAIEIAPFSIFLAAAGPASAEFRTLAAENVRGRRIRIWKAFLGEHGEVTSAEMEEDAIQDRVKLHDGPKAELELECLGNFAFLATQAVGRWTPEHQKSFLAKLGIDPATDTGFDEQHGIPEKNVGWFRPS